MELGGKVEIFIVSRKKRRRRCAHLEVDIVVESDEKNGDFVTQTLGQVDRHGKCRSLCGRQLPVCSVLLHPSSRKLLTMGQTTSTPVAASSPPLSCPMHEKPVPTKASPPAGCPMHEETAKAAQCPVDHSALNQMPVLSQTPAPHQTVSLPIERTVSSIPRDGAERWEYPSPQQFYNALVRKGWETPEEHVETMVEIHNFLNEQAWEEVLRWERRAGMMGDLHLARFKGRPGEMSPKARFWMFAGWLLPSRFK